MEGGLLWAVDISHQVLALFFSIYAYQIRFYTIGSLIFSYGLATKLPLILAGPAILLILAQTLGSRMQHKLRVPLQSLKVRLKVLSRH